MDKATDNNTVIDGKKVPYKLPAVDPAKSKTQGQKAVQVKKKKKKSFPDLNKDGKVTMKDVLIGRGVIKKAKMGMQMKGTSPLLKKRK